MEKRKSNPIFVGVSLGSLPGFLIGLVWTMMASGSGESGLAAIGIICSLSIGITIIGVIIGALVGYLMSRARNYQYKATHDIDDIVPPDMR